MTVMFSASCAGSSKFASMPSRRGASRRWKALPPGGSRHSAPPERAHVNGVDRRRAQSRVLREREDHVIQVMQLDGLPIVAPAVGVVRIEELLRRDERRGAAETPAGVYCWC
jgi:hypothetical protein